MSQYPLWHKEWVCLWLHHHWLLLLLLGRALLPHLFGLLLLMGLYLPPRLFGLLLLQGFSLLPRHFWLLLLTHLVGLFLLLGSKRFCYFCALMLIYIPIFTYRFMKISLKENLVAGSNPFHLFGIESLPLIWWCISI